MTKLIRPVFLNLCLAMVVAASAGDLNPPGAPASTVNPAEPRTPISDLPFEIHDPGSYFLTQSLAASPGEFGITISAPDVTIDLNGFTLSGTTGSFNGISTQINGLGIPERVTIRNGSVIDFGGQGIDLLNVEVCTIEDVTIDGNEGRGIRLGPKSIIRRAVVLNSGNAGVDLDNDSSLIESTVIGSNNFGVEAQNRVIIRDCRVGDNNGGIRVQGDCQVIGNSVLENGQGSAPAISVAQSGNLIEGNRVEGSGRGLLIQLPGNIVRNNTVLQNSLNYDIAQGNQLDLLLSEIPEVLDWPCSVTLTGTLEGDSGRHGIIVQANGVQIDLAGHTLDGVDGSLDGIFVSGEVTGLTVRNGTVSRWGANGIGANNADRSIIENIHALRNFETGIDIGDDSVVARCTVEGVGQAGVSRPSEPQPMGFSFDFWGIRANNGTTIIECTSTENQFDGIEANEGCVIRSSTAYRNGSSGIDARTSTVVDGCSAYDNDFRGIEVESGSVVSNSTVGRNGADGIHLTEGTVVDCAAYFNEGVGIDAGSESTVSDCSATTSSSHGIEVGSRSTVSRCTAGANGNGVGIGSGIRASGRHNRIDDNNVADNDIGIEVTLGTNIIIRNTAISNGASTGDNYSIAADNDFGTIITLAGSGEIVAINPWANFSR